MTRLPILMLSLACAAMRLSAQSYVGTWALVLVDRVSPDGSRVHLYGDDPQGLMTLDAEGRYTMEILKAGRPLARPVGSPPGGKPQRRPPDPPNPLDLARNSDGPSFAGTWTLTVADEIRPDGTRIHAYGDHPEGQLIFDNAGHYSVWVSRAMQTKFKSGDKARGTADEYKAATVEISAHYGRYAVDTASHTLTFDIVHSSFPNLDGVEQRRPYELNGDELTYRIPPRADGTISISSWRRMR